MQPLILHALQFANLREVKGPASNPILLDMIRDVFPGWKDDSTIAWCAIFLIVMCRSMCYEETMHLKHPALARSFLDIGLPIERENLRVGDIVIFDRGKGRGHVGFFLRDHGTHITVFGGNQGDAVTISDYRMPFLGGRRLRTLEQIGTHYESL